MRAVRAANRRGGPPRSRISLTLILVSFTFMGAAAGYGWYIAAPHALEVVPEASPIDRLDDNEKAKLTSQRQIVAQQIELLKQTSERLLHGDDSGIPTTAQHSTQLSTSLIDAQKRTLESRTLLVAVQGAVANDGDLRPFLQQLAVDATLRDSAMALIESDRDLRNEHSNSANRHSSPFKAKAIHSPELKANLIQLATQRFRQALAQENFLRQMVESVKLEKSWLDVQSTQIETIESEWQQLMAIVDSIAIQPTELELNAESRTNPGLVSLASPMATTVILCMFLGFAIGLFLLFLKDILHDRFDSVAILQRSLNLPLLAEIQRLELQAGSGLNAVATFASNDGMAAKPFRNLRSAITFSPKDAQRILITSADRGDGKTTVVTNLAVSFAHANRKTLLIDADIGHRGTTQVLDLQGSRGLTQILRDEKSITQSCLENIFNLGVEHLDVLPAGARPEDIPGLLSSKRFDEMMGWAEANYDQILFDGPSIGSWKEIEQLGRFVDGLILVACPGKNRKLLLKALESCRAASIPVIGFVANQMTTRFSARSVSSNRREVSGVMTDNNLEKPRIAA